MRDLITFDKELNRNYRAPTCRALAVWMPACRKAVALTNAQYYSNRVQKRMSPAGSSARSETLSDKLSLLSRFAKLEVCPTPSALVVQLVEQV